MIELLFTVLKLSIIEMLYMTGLIILVGFILGLLEKLSNNFIQRAFGRKGIYFTAWLGTPIHEIGHAFMCLLFRHKIRKIKLLNIQEGSEVLGYVQHGYDENNMYQRVGNLFIGLGPIFSGTLSLVIGLNLLLPHSFSVFRRCLIDGVKDDRIDVNLIKYLFNAVGNLIQSVFTLSNLSNPFFWIYIILALCISSHIALSKADIRGAEDGFIALFLFVFIINIVLRFFSINSKNYIIKLSRYNAHLLAFLMIALIFSILGLTISFISYGITSSIGKIRGR